MQINKRTYLKSIFLSLLFSIYFPVICRNIITGTLPCRIIDKRTHEAVEDADLCIKELSICKCSDSSGNILFKDISTGLFIITGIAEGYDPVFLPNISINSGINNLLTVELTKSTDIRQLEKMVVTESKIIQKSPEQITSVARLSNFELSSTAGTANDINRVLETLPSIVCTGANFDNALYVRGGHSRENVYIIDGIEIDNISHFSDISGSGGAIGYINGALVDHLDFYAGGIPASFPPRTSSAIDINIRNGSLVGRKYHIDLNMSGLGLTLEGPFPKKCGSYLLGVRFIDMHLLQSFLKQTGIPRFGDSQSKFKFFLGEKNSISLTNVFGFDTYNEENEQSGMGFPTDWSETLYQFGTGLNWETITDKMRNRLHASFNLRNEEYFEEVSSFTEPFSLSEISMKYNMHYPEDTIITVNDTALKVQTEIAEKELFGSVDNRKQISLKDDITIYFRDADQLNIGLNARREIFELGEREGTRQTIKLSWYPDTTDTSVIKDSIIQNSETFDIDSSIAGDNAGGYFQYIFKQGILKWTAGLRADYFRLLRDYSFSPRAGLSINAYSVGLFSISGGLYYQVPSDLSGNLADLIVPDPNVDFHTPQFWEIDLQRNRQAVLGYEKQFAKSHILNFEAYYKWYDREYTLIDPDTYFYEKKLYEAIESGEPFKFPKPDGTKKACGLEISFQKKQQKGIYYAAGYSIFSIKNRYADGKWYSDSRNVRNSLALTIGANFLKLHTLSLRLAVAGGRPYSKVISDTLGILHYDSTSGFFTERLQPTCNLNLRYNFRFFRKWGNITGYLEIWNLLNYTPVVERYKGFYSYRDYQGNGIIPLAGITIDF